MSEPRIIIPDHLQAYLEAEHCDDFNINRYFLTKDQEEIFQNIIRMQGIVEEMQNPNWDIKNYMPGRFTYEKCPEGTIVIK